MTPAPTRAEIQSEMETAIAEAIRSRLPAYFAAGESPSVIQFLTDLSIPTVAALINIAMVHVRRADGSPDSLRLLAADFRRILPVTADELGAGKQEPAR